MSAIPDDAPARAGRWLMRPRTVRAKIVCLLMVPVVSLLALWAYATVTTAQDVARLRQLQRVDAGIRTPSPRPWPRSRPNGQPPSAMRPTRRPGGATT